MLKKKRQISQNFFNEIVTLLDFFSSDELLMTWTVRPPCPQLFILRLRSLTAATLTPTLQQPAGWTLQGCSPTELSGLLPLLLIFLVNLS